MNSGLWKTISNGISTFSFGRGVKVGTLSVSFESSFSILINVVAVASGFIKML